MPGPPSPGFCAWWCWCPGFSVWGCSPQPWPSGRAMPWPSGTVTRPGSRPSSPPCPGARWMGGGGAPATFWGPPASSMPWATPWGAAGRTSSPWSISPRRNMRRRWRPQAAMPGPSWTGPVSPRGHGMTWRQAISTCTPSPCAWRGSWRMASSPPAPFPSGPQGLRTPPGSKSTTIPRLSPHRRRPSPSTPPGITPVAPQKPPPSPTGEPGMTAWPS